MQPLLYLLYWTLVTVNYTVGRRYSFQVVVKLTSKIDERTL